MHPTFSSCKAHPQLLYQLQPPTRRLPKLKIIFWLQTSTGIVAHFLIVIAFDPTRVTCRPIQIILIFIIVFFLLVGLTRLSCIDFCGWSRTFQLLFPGVSSALFFLMLLGILSLLLLWLSFYRPSLRFIYSRVFHRVTLSASFSGVGSAAVQTLLVHVFDI